MKKHLSLILLISFFSTICISQVDENKPMSSFSFKLYKNKIERQKNDEKRLKKAERKLEKKYISSNQVYKTIGYFDNNDYKLAYAQTVFEKLSDKSNSLRICDGIKQQSHYTIIWEYYKEEAKKYNVNPADLVSYVEYIKLKDKQKDKQYDDQYDFFDYSIEQSTTNELNSGTNTSMTNISNPATSDTNNTQEDTEQEQIDKSQNPKNSEIIFPDFTNYQGTTNCSQLMSEQVFYAFANALTTVPTDEQKAEIAIEYANKYCFPTVYVMKVSIFIKDENIRYVYFKTVYDKIYDKENFHHTAQLIKDEKLKAELLKLK